MVAGVDNELAFEDRLIGSDKDRDGLTFLDGESEAVHHGGVVGAPFRGAEEKTWFASGFFLNNREIGEIEAVITKGRAQVVNRVPDGFLELLLASVGEVHADFHLHGRSHFRNVEEN